MKVTIRTLAAEAGVHHTTVSRALRNDPRLTEETGERLRRLAVERGYTPDPMLTALMVHRRKAAPPRVQATLGWITADATREGWRVGEKEGYFAGAQRRAAELGYGIEEFWLGDKETTVDRTTKALLARPIQGLLFLPHPRARAHLRLDWRRFSAISFGHSLVRPALHTVDTHHFHSMRTIMRNLKKRGYRRIGLACRPEMRESVDRNWTAAYWAYQPRAYHVAIPPFAERSWKRDVFFRWLDRNRPEAVVSNDGQVLEWMRGRGMRVPEKIGFVLTTRQEAAPGIAGIDENAEQIGAAAVDLLVGMIHRGERGIPPSPLSSLVEGTWVGGSTVRYLNRPNLDPL